MKVPMPIRRAVILGAVLALLLTAPAAAAGDLRAQVNALRARSGLAPVAASDPAAARLAADIAASGGHSWTAPTGRSATGVGFFTWERAGSLEAAVAGSPSVLAMLLDPRVRTLDVATAGGYETIAVTVDPSAPFPGAVPVQRKVDPLGAAPPAWVAPPGTGGSAVVQLRLHGRWRAFGTAFWPFVRVTAPTGAVLVRTGLGWEFGGIPFGTRMRLRTAAGASGEVPVKRLDTAVRHRSFSFRRGITAARRRRVTRAVRHANPLVRRLLAQVDGLTAFEAAPLGARVLAETGTDPSSRDLGYLVTLATSSFMLSRRSFELAVLHELGHVVQMAGLHGADYRAADRAIPRGGRCTRRDRAGGTGPCAQSTERIADTFAKWALNTRTMPGVGYDVPAPRSFRPFARAFRRFALRPASTPALRP
jgi:hypothetical protein